MLEMLAKNSPTFGSQLIGEGERMVNGVWKKKSVANRVVSKRRGGSERKRGKR